MVAQKTLDFKTLYIRDCNGIRTRNDLVSKRTLNYLAIKIYIYIYIYIYTHISFKRLSSVLWLILLNDWVWVVFVYELSGSGFESHCSHFNFKYHAWFLSKKKVPWHSGNCRVYIHSETCSWHDDMTRRYSQLYVS